MTKEPSQEKALVPASDPTVDAAIALFAMRTMGETVAFAEGQHPRMTSGDTAAKAFVAQLFTNAVFDQDIYAIQTIINRIDGGVPKDVDVDNYRTLFGDCLAEVMEMSSVEQLTVKPDDTVMMALCKSLVDLAVTDIYVDRQTGRHISKPRADVKREHDSAVRMILERMGGRKTSQAIVEEEKQPELASWIKLVLPESDDM